MADLEDLGYLQAQHASAGRFPTEAGLKMFVSGLLEVGRITSDERAQLDALGQQKGRSVDSMLDDAVKALSGLSRCAGLVVAPQLDAEIKHVEFVALGNGQALAVIVNASGEVENRVLDLPPGLPPSVLQEASNFLNARLANRTFSQAKQAIYTDLETQKGQLDALASKVVKQGLATWSGNGPDDGQLIVHGQVHLLDDISAQADLARVRDLFAALETKERVLRVLDLLNGAEGVQIFIGADNDLFTMAGCSMIVAPYQNSRQEIVGALGVIGPTRINYARIIPMVDYTARVISRLLG
jgi:heat-inducible transcriptional repressor